MFGRPSKWRLLLAGFPLWQPGTDFWRKTTNWPILGKYARLMHNEDHYDVTFIPINKELEKDVSTVIPKQVVTEMIRESCHRVIMRVCLCRVGCGCDNHPMEFGCIFLGDSARDIDPSMGKAVSVEEAEAHVERCIESGLIPQIGRVDADPFMLGVKNWDRFLTLCFCCTCCCVAMRQWQTWSPKVQDCMHRLDGLSIEISDECNGCGKCVNACFTSAISVKGESAYISDDCRGCGICATVCPNEAITLTVSDGDKLLDNSFKRLRSYADVT